MKNKRFSVALLSLPLLTATLLTGHALLLPTLAAAQGADPVAQRQDAMKQLAALMKPLKATSDSGKNVGAAQTQAQQMATLMRTAATLFPPGSAGSASKALPAVWSQPDQFAKDFTQASSAAESLQQAAEANDAAGFSKAFGAVAKSCGECHRPFRGR